MSYSDPLTISSLAGVTSLPRTGSGIGSGEFTSPDRTVRLVVSNSYGKRIRRAARLTQTLVSSDPLIPSQNVTNNASVTVVVDHPVNGFTATDLKAIADTLTAWLTASSGANTAKLIGGES